MKIAYTSTFDAQNVRSWSGTPFYMSQALQNHGAEVHYIGSLAKQTQPFFKIKKIWKKFACGQRESPRFNIHSATHYSRQVAEQLRALPADVVIAPHVNPIAYLDCKQKLILWTDGLYASFVGFYPGFSSHSANTIQEGNIITQACLSRCDLAIFSSDWAARTALEIYGVSKDKVKVVPFGANLDKIPTLDEVCQFIRSRSKSTIKLLFLGKHWDRKGGQIVFAVTQALHAAGHAVELNFVGCEPPSHIEIPDYIHVHGFISKRTPDGMARITQMLQESHFLFVPSRAEAYGIVFCEANAFGLPCLTTHVGGIGTIIKDHINGMTFALDAPISAYCNFIVDAMKNYEALALSSFHEFETRLNWKTAVTQVMRLINAAK